MTRHIEDTIQSMIITWADYKLLPRHLGGAGRTIGDYIVASANGGRRHPREAGRLKKQGVRAGFPDLQLTVANNGYHGLYIELKRPKSRGVTAGAISKEQRVWNKRLNEQGYLAVFSYGFEATVKVIEEYLIDKN